MIDLTDLQPGDRITVAGMFSRIIGSPEAGDARHVVFEIGEVSYSVAPSAVVSFSKAWKQGDIAYSASYGRGEVLKVRDDTAIVLWNDAGLGIGALCPLSILSRSPWSAK